MIENLRTQTARQITSAKSALRVAMKARRSSITTVERTKAADALAAHGISYAKIPPPAVIGAFLPIGSEINPLPLVTRLRASGHAIALPRMAGKDQPLAFHLHEPGDSLKTAVWGIREPLITAPLVVPDIVLVALLAFDDRGFRLGYGGGYYDRTLKALGETKKIVTIGIAFDNQRVDVVPTADYDVPLDWILTPAGSRRATAPNNGPTAGN